MTQSSKVWETPTVTGLVRCREFKSCSAHFQSINPNSVVKALITVGRRMQDIELRGSEDFQGVCRVLRSSPAWLVAADVVPTVKDWLLWIQMHLLFKCSDFFWNIKRKYLFTFEVIRLPRKYLITLEVVTSLWELWIISEVTDCYEVSWTLWQTQMGLCSQVAQRVKEALPGVQRCVSSNPGRDT